MARSERENWRCGEPTKLKSPDRVIEKVNENTAIRMHLRPSPNRHRGTVHGRSHFK